MLLVLISLEVKKIPLLVLGKGKKAAKVFQESVKSIDPRERIPTTEMDRFLTLQGILVEKEFLDTEKGLTLMVKQIQKHSQTGKTASYCMENTGSYIPMAARPGSMGSRHSYG